MAWPILPDVLCGLSPLARGTHQPQIKFVRRRRFIPAGAGNTHGSSHQCIALTVYPRWRGEHFPKESAVAPDAGLSPLARGTQSPKVFSKDGRRFIPAGAGNTSTTYPARRSLPVYPRWRGEHVVASNKFERWSGLSPLARGTQPPGHLWKSLTRFIPAGAGNTNSGE